MSQFPSKPLKQLSPSSAPFSPSSFTPLTTPIVATPPQVPLAPPVASHVPHYSPLAVMSIQTPAMLQLQAFVRAILNTDATISTRSYGLKELKEFILDINNEVVIRRTYDRLHPTLAQLLSDRSVEIRESVAKVLGCLGASIKNECAKFFKWAFQNLSMPVNVNINANVTTVSVAPFSVNSVNTGNAVNANTAPTTNVTNPQTTTKEVKLLVLNSLKEFLKVIFEREKDRGDRASFIPFVPAFILSWKSYLENLNDLEFLPICIDILQHLTTHYLSFFKPHFHEFSVIIIDWILDQNLNENLITVFPVVLHSFHPLWIEYANTSTDTLGKILVCLENAVHTNASSSSTKESATLSSASIFSPTQTTNITPTQQTTSSESPIKIVTGKERSARTDTHVSIERLIFYVDCFTSISLKIGYSNTNVASLILLVHRLFVLFKGIHDIFHNSKWLESTHKTVLLIAHSLGQKFFALYPPTLDFLHAQLSPLPRVSKLCEVLQLNLNVLYAMNEASTPNTVDRIFKPTPIQNNTQSGVLHSHLFLQLRLHPSPLVRNLISSTYNYFLHHPKEAVQERIFELLIDEMKTMNEVLVRKSVEPQTPPIVIYQNLTQNQPPTFLSNTSPSTPSNLNLTPENNLENKSVEQNVIPLPTPYLVIVDADELNYFNQLRHLSATNSNTNVNNTNIANTNLTNNNPTLQSTTNTQTNNPQQTTTPQTPLLTSFNFHSNIATLSPLSSDLLPFPMPLYSPASLTDIAIVILSYDILLFSLPTPNLNTNINNNNNNNITNVQTNQNTNNTNIISPLSPITSPIISSSSSSSNTANTNTINLNITTNTNNNNTMLTSPMTSPRSPKNASNPTSPRDLSPTILSPRNTIIPTLSPPIISTFSPIILTVNTLPSIVAQLVDVLMNTYHPITNSIIVRYPMIQSSVIKTFLSIYPNMSSHTIGSLISSMLLNTENNTTQQISNENNKSEKESSSDNNTRSVHSPLNHTETSELSSNINKEKMDHAARTPPLIPSHTTTLKILALDWLKQYLDGVSLTNENLDSLENSGVLISLMRVTSDIHETVRIKVASLLLSIFTKKNFHLSLLQVSLSIYSTIA